MSIDVVHVEHRNALGKEESQKKIAHLPFSQGEDLGILRGPFCAAVPVVILIGSISIAFAIVIIVLALVGDKVTQTKAIVGCDEIDAAERRS